ncbi:MAG TPA: YtxH domain-containing protein [Chitinophagaceae bacterium]|jgi:gas vesicle protein
MSLPKILVGAFAGLLAGAVIGILTAPASGTETRQKITGSANDLKKRIRRLAGKTDKEMDRVKTSLTS